MQKLQCPCQKKLKKILSMRGISPILQSTFAKEELLNGSAVNLWSQLTMKLRWALLPSFKITKTNDHNGKKEEFRSLATQALNSLV